MNKKGQLSIDKIIIIAVIVGGIMFAIYLASILVPVISTTFGVFGDAIEGSPEILRYADSPTRNDSSQIIYAIERSETAIENFSYLPYVFLAVGIIMFIIFAINVQFHPSLVIIWFILVGVIVAISIPLSNSYSYLSSNNPTVYASQSALTNLYLSNLPTLFSVLGLVGGIFLFIRMDSNKQGETLV